MITAHFDQNDHALNSGWATYHRKLGWRRMVCMFRHAHLPPPAVQNGYSPSGMARCTRCHSWLKWFAVGQHRYGGMNR